MRSDTRFPDGVALGLIAALLSVILVISAACSADGEPAATRPAADPTRPPDTTPAEATVPVATPDATATTAPTATNVTPAAEPTTAPTATATAAPPPTPTPSPTPTEPPTATPLPDAPLIHIGETVYVLDLAVTPDERAQGLSGREFMPDERGMLFVYDHDGPRTFWMPNMHFPLDMVWIREDCTVAGVTADVPNPPLDTPRDQLELYPSTGMVRFILELNAGQAAQHDIEAGGIVRFDGQIAGMWGC